LKSLRMHSILRRIRYQMGSLIQASSQRPLLVQSKPL
jgi:hypothetical protein